jgi:hypothetical protein
VTHIGGGLSIGGNQALTDLTGLDALRSINGSLSIAVNTGLKSLHGLDALAYVGGDLFIGENAALPQAEIDALTHRLGR